MAKAFCLIKVGAILAALAGYGSAEAQEVATLAVRWPVHGAEIALGSDPERAIGVVAKSNFDLRPAGQCGSNARCGHLHLKIGEQAVINVRHGT